MLTIKASYKTPGLTWKQQPDGSYAGRLYTAWPQRLVTRILPSFIVGILMTMLVVWAADKSGPASAPLDVAFGLGIATLVYAVMAYPLLVIWPYWPFSTKIAMDAQHLKIGWRRYRLADVGHFKLKENGDQLPFLAFSYGRKTIAIGIKNGHSHSVDIATFLTKRAAELNEKNKESMMPKSASGVRSASF